MLKKNPSLGRVGLLQVQAVLVGGKFAGDNLADEFFMFNLLTQIGLQTVLHGFDECVPDIFGNLIRRERLFGLLSLAGCGW